MNINITAPISTIMSTNLKTVLGRDSIAKAKEIFDNHKIHHLPVIGFNTVRGVLSKVDLITFLRGSLRNRTDDFLEETRLKSWKVDEIMTPNFVALNKNDSVIKALEIFASNEVHCILIQEEEQLVGILTPHDIILSLAKKGKRKLKKAKVA